MPLFCPVYMRKSFRGKDGQLPILVNLSEHLFEKKLTRLTEPRANNKARAFSDCLAFTEPKCLYGERLARLSGSPLWKTLNNVD